jgi:hypothetical protein
VHTLDALQPLQDAPELAAHATQVAAAEAPVAVEYVPAAQYVQSAKALTVVEAYVPASHFKQPALLFVPVVVV